MTMRCSGIGVKRHPLFCVRGLFGRKTRSKDDGSGEHAMTAAAAASEAELEKEAELDDLARHDTAVRLQNLRKVYKSQRTGLPPVVAVKSATFSVRRHECFGLLGPNGSGKTTLINCLNGFFEPTGGTAQVMGFDIRTDMSSIHQRLGVCPQASATL